MQGPWGPSPALWQHKACSRQCVPRMRPAPTPQPAGPPSSCRRAAAETLGLEAEGPQGTRLTPVRRPRAAQERAEGRPDSGLPGSATRAHRHCGSRGCTPPAVTALSICARLGLQPPHRALWKPEPRSEESGCSHPLPATTGRRPGRHSGRPSICLGRGGAGSGEGPSRPHRAGQWKTTTSPHAAPQALGMTDHRLSHICLGPTAAVAPPPPVSSEAVSSEPREVPEAG